MGTTTVKHMHMLKVGINSSLIVIALLFLAGIVWQLRAEVVEPPLAPINTLRAQATQALYWNWYNKTDLALAARQTTAELDDAQINAELLGVIINGGFSAATMTVEGRPEAVFHVGDELKPGIMVNTIEPYRVIVEDRGQLAQINMKKSELILGTQAPANVMDDQQGFSVPNMFSAVPVSGDNFDAGFKISSLSQEIETMTDIQVGDVLVEIGSHSIEDLMTDPSLWMEYSANTEVPVVLLRNGQEVLLNVNAFSLAAKALPSVARDLMP